MKVSFKLRECYDAKPNWSTPVIIASHINGLRSKDHNPNTPIGHEEVAAEAIKCWEAGACAIHLHNSNIHIGGEESYEDYMKTLRIVKDKYPGLFWYPTGTSATSDTLSGNEHVELLKQREGVCFSCVDCGSANLPFAIDDKGNLAGVTYAVPFDVLNRQVQSCIDHEIGIIWGIYEPGYLRTAQQYIKHGRTSKGSSIDFYFFGDHGSVAIPPINTNGVPPTLEGLYFYLDLMGDCGLPWFVSIWGEGSADTRPFIKRVIELGGHVNTGLELFYDPARNPTNVELLQEAQEIAREVGRPLARQDEVKSILGLA
jgi:uncharacterized protein (DUF849 family)